MALFDKLFRREAPVEKASTQSVQQSVPEQKQQKLPFDCWMAVRGGDKDSIAQALGLVDVVSCDWEEGVERLHMPNTLLVTDEADGACFVIGASLPNLAYHARASARVAGFAEKFETVYYFCASQNADTYYFAHLKNGEYRRLYAAAQGEVKINKGGISEAEQAKGLRFPADDDELFDGGGEITKLMPQSILTLAQAWNADPSSARGHGGITGKIDR